MPDKLELLRVGDDVFEIKVPNADAARSLAAQIVDQSLAEEVVPGLERLSLRVAPARLGQLKDRLETLQVTDQTETEPTDPIDIPVRYGGRDGPDFDAVCAQLNLSAQALISQHCACLHRVEMIGFTPGFAYISGVPKALHIARLTTPRPRLEAGAIGLSAGFTGIYAMPGPGGWPIIGRTEIELFNPSADPPFTLKPGHAVRFRAI